VALEVGNAGTGSLTVNGGTVSSSGELRVGDSGSGTLTITNGEISNTIGNIARQAGSLGTVEMSGGNWTNTDSLIIGNAGTGTFTLSGGTVSSSVGRVGYNAGSDGTATVSGGTWTTSSDFYIGDAGRGQVTLTDDGTISVNDGAGTVYLASQSGSLGTLSFGSHDLLNPTSAGTLKAAAIVFGAETGAGTIEFNQKNNLTVNAVISGAGRIFQRGSAETALTGANSYSGGTFITGSALVALHDTALGTGAVSIDGGQLRAGPDITLANPISVESLGGEINNYGSYAKSTYSGAITLGGRLTVAAYSDAPASTTVTGGITGTGNLHFYNAEPAAVVVSGAAVNPAGTILHDGGGTGSTTISAPIGSNVTGITQNSATSSLILDGVSTYSGTTTVTTGLLEVNGSISGTTNVSSAGTLGGGGTFGDVVLSGVLAPGNGIATLNASSLTWNVDAHFVFELGATTSDQLNLSGALTKGGAGTFVFDFQNAGWVEGRTYTLINFGSTNFSVGDFSFSGADGFDGTFAVNGNSLTFHVASVPEPSVWSLALLGLLVAVVLSRSRAKREAA
jgi:T5SS/PEP-CTERM-associated repeat protein